MTNSGAFAMVEQPDGQMRHARTAANSVAIFLISLTVLMLEVLLIRVFDTIALQNIGYMVITCAMFGLGLAGLYSILWPAPDGETAQRRLGSAALLLAVSVLLLRPSLNAVPLLTADIENTLLRYGVAGITVYLAIVIPFFLAGLIFSLLFATYPKRINTLYFWDLAGAALGCVIFLPFIREIGPGGLMFCGAAGVIIAAGLFIGRNAFLVALTGASILLALPFLRTEGYYDFEQLQDKRGLKTARLAGLVEFTAWDPISKIEIVNAGDNEPSSGATSTRLKHIAYDGGSQSSNFFAFDGDYAALRKRVMHHLGTEGHFWNRGVLASHYLKRDTGSDVLIIGSAGGQETKAALLFNPRSVDGIELVGTVVDLGQGLYADYIGGIFTDPRVRNRVGEGRSFLRGSARSYDIIQIYSNHLSSNIASGIGATNPNYLQTVEAYMEYFTHLGVDGVLHINHHFYPRMITTAALAWQRLGRTDFQRHVAVFERDGTEDTLPTMLIKMSPWSRAEIEDLESFFALDAPSPSPARLVVDPARLQGFLPAEVFHAPLSASAIARAGYRLWASTDDQPYFNYIQKNLSPVDIDPARFLNAAMVSAVNGRLSWFAGQYTAFVVVGLGGLLCSLALVLLPLTLSPVGRASWPGKYTSIGYFSCLGAGFIMIELVLIQLFMQPIGFPLYTYAVVLFTLLLSAALGSFMAPRLGVAPDGRWALPFAGVLGTGAAFLLLYPTIFAWLLGLSLEWRILGSAALIFPLGFFMGMPFPLGILSVRRQPLGAIAWAWGINAIFTVIGGLLCGVLSIEIGFHRTLITGLLLYAVALPLIVSLMRSHAGQPARSAPLPTHA